MYLLSRTGFQPRLSSILSLALPMVLLAGLAAAPAALAQTPPTPPRPAAAPRTPGAPTPTVSDKDFATTQDELIRLLRLSPTLTTVVARDPSLLSNADYVRRNNPQLAQYLDTHPEIGLNPDYYLFTRLEGQNGQREDALERKVWPDVAGHNESPLSERLMGDAAPVLVFLCVTGVFVWLTRMFLENRRWGRIFKLQTEVHGKLIDRFSSSTELLTYMSTDAGKRFLEAAPIPVDFEPQQRMPHVVARVLMPLQIGLVLTLLGIGFWLVRHASTDMEVPMQVLGILFLMPGIGFILSAGITWVLAGRLGLMPEAISPATRDRQ